MIVVGTGPAGLTAAHLLSMRGAPNLRLLELAAEPGGMWAGWEDKGRYFERGMHNYIESGVKAVDDFYFNLPVQRHVLEGKDRDRAGIYYDGRLQTWSPAIDLRGTYTCRAVLGEIMDLLQLEDWKHGTTAIELATHKWGKTYATTIIAPILKKLFGTQHLHPRALDLTNLHRAILLGEAAMRELMPSAWLRDRLAWPDQETLPDIYSSRRRAFYPSEGMRALVSAAIGDLRSRGVDVAIGVEVAAAMMPCPIYWAAGLPKLAKALGINFPELQSRSLTVVNFTGGLDSHGLHYFHCYEPKLKTFRVTCYGNFSFFNQTSVEILSAEPHEGADLAIAELEAMGFATKDLKFVNSHFLRDALVVPTAINDDLLEHFRRRVAEIAPNIVLLGTNARNGLFFQPDVLRHVWNTVTHYEPKGKP